jgi:hypothetical protein
MEATFKKNDTGQSFNEMNLLDEKLTSSLGQDDTLMVHMDN